jgi:hypothetical protein
MVHENEVFFNLRWINKPFSKERSWINSPHFIFKHIALFNAYLTFCYINLSSNFKQVFYCSTITCHSILILVLPLCCENIRREGQFTADPTGLLILLFRALRFIALLGALRQCIIHHAFYLGSPLRSTFLSNLNASLYNCFIAHVVY